MRIRCVAAVDGAALCSTDLAHGEDPRHAVWQHGLSLIRPLTADRMGGSIVLTVLTAPHALHRYPRVRRPRGLDPDVVVAPGEEPLVRQRVAAYAIVTSSRGVLGTEFSDQTHVGGHWGLPGGGVEDDEQPAEAVVREIAEETGQRVVLGPLVDVQSDHWIGRAPNGVLEDFHALRLIYSAHCPDPGDPVVHDVGGTTAAAGWTPLADWRRTPWATGSRSLLEKHLVELSQSVRR